MPIPGAPEGQARDRSRVRVPGLCMTKQAGSLQFKRCTSAAAEEMTGPREPIRLV